MAQMRIRGDMDRSCVEIGWTAWSTGPAPSLAWASRQQVPVGSEWWSTLVVGSKPTAEARMLLAS